MDSGDNVLFLGPPGVGNSPLGLALGLKAREQGVRTLFGTATALIATLGKALVEGRLEERLKLLSQTQLLIVDEIGYLPLDRQGASPFFQLVRALRSAARSFSPATRVWEPGVRCSATFVASAILDRLLHHSIMREYRSHWTKFPPRTPRAWLQPRPPWADWDSPSRS